MVAEQLPEHYSKGWRHVESVDPAMKSKFGYTLWAEDPTTGIWYLIEDKYIEGMLNPQDLVEDVKKKSSGYNIIRRISDPHEGWYIGQASKVGITYITPYDKNSRKNDLIKGLQKSLSDGKIKICGWCTIFIDEIQSCQWSETSDRIVNASSYHALDCAQYFCDLIPKAETINIVKPWHVELREQNQSRKREKSKQLKMQSAVKNKSRIGKGIGTWGRRGIKLGGRK